MKTALDGHRLNAFGMDPFKFVLIGHDTDDGPEHPLYDHRIKDLKRRGREAVEYLIPSILDDGYLHNVLVRKNGHDTEVGIGRNRVFAGRIIIEQKLWKKSEPLEVPTMVKKYADDRWRQIILAENLARKDSDAVTEALQFAEFVKHQPSPARLRYLTKMTTADIDKMLAIVQMTKPVQDKIVERQIPRRIAMELARVHTRDQMAALDEYLDLGLPTEAAARAIADRRLGVVQSAPRRFYLADEVQASPTGELFALAGAPSGGGLIASGAQFPLLPPPAAPPVASAPTAEGPTATSPTTEREKSPVPPREVLRDMLAEVQETDPKKVKLSDEAVAFLRWVVTGDNEALKAVPELRPLVKKGIARGDKRRKERDERKASREGAGAAAPANDAE